MTFKEYLSGLQEFAKEHPEALELTAVYAGDSEGNYFDEVYHNTPSLGMMFHDDFYDEASCEEDELEYKPTVVCIN
jgi:hypothetical protein